MALPEPPTYDVGQIERAAHDFLRERFGPSVSIPVDIDLLVESLPGVDLDYWPALRANHRLDGMVMRDPESGDLFVYIDEHIADTQPNRYRMTVAEELGHLVLHRKVIESVASPEDFRAVQNHYRGWNMERNAKRFAAAILMPAENVLASPQALYPQLVRVAGYNDSAAVKKHLVSMLAKEFVVSVESMGFRVIEWPIRLTEKVDQAMRDRLDFLG